jgi:hypothetical protein
MKNLLSYCGLSDSSMNVSDTDLPVTAQIIQDFCPGSLLESRAEIFGWYFGRNDELINTF